MPEYEAWKERNNGGKGWHIKYYKGLGTSTANEMKEYCKGIRKHKKDFRYTGETCDDRITLAFSKKRIEDRKTWLGRFVEGTFLDHNMSRVPYKDFIDRELILFSLADNMRSIPSAVDGLKPGQRKILFACFKKKMKKEIKVAQLQGYVGEQAAYHHGEMSLVQTIVGMAQNFCGSNNINILYPSGQFGTRNMGGKDAASARYIFTKLCPIARNVFHADDDQLLDYLDDDGLTVEPKWYMPTIPMALVNGAEGIGTGYATFLPNYNPRQIIRNIRHMLNGDEMEPMHPFYKNWSGKLMFNHNKKSVGYMTIGRVVELGPNAVQIEELPVREWTDKYKTAVLEKLVEAGKIDDIRTYHTTTTVCFQIQFNESFGYTGIHGDFFRKLKLVGSLPTSNIVLFNHEGKLQKFENAEQVLRDFYGLRMQYYDMRKKRMLENLDEQRRRLSNRERFILMIVREELKINRRKKRDICEELNRLRFEKFYPKTNKKGAPPVDENNEEEEEKEESKLELGYKYLLSMPIYSLTYEKVEQLKKERMAKEEELDKLYKTPVKAIYRRDLTELEKAIDDHEAEENKKKKYRLRGRSSETAKAHRG
eukprot:TRINITY_DN199_c0_g2_i8.p1 TRINITY_DN199_c0_g2~~TRINITY_DN199_c0_g2_i8.p1  ORF type:complete len:593 (-),score=207.75 TRINITY_DN199_c0_g2_i8:2-1780(-)